MKKTVLILFITAISINSYSQSFITLWDMNNSGFTLNEIRFNIEITDSVKYKWETVPAGISDSGYIYNNNVIISNIPTGSIIKLNIDSNHFKRFFMSNTSDSNRLIDILQWGSVAWNSMEHAFDGCSYLSINATDVPNLNNVKSMAYMFCNCTSLDGPSNINTWNTSQIENMEGCFMNAVIFNQPIGSWDVAKVKNMSRMFLQAKLFNQPLYTWNTAQVNNMEMMFMYTLYFNQDINNWNTSSVINMKRMFKNTFSFNQPLNNWNTGQVTDMSEMFYKAYIFNQDINNWDVSNVKSMQDMFREAYSFNQDLNNWDVSNVNNMLSMFQEAYAFNGSIENWNTYNVLNFNCMFFKSTSFNHSVGHFRLNPGVKIDYMLWSSGLDCINYANTIKSWATSDSIFYGKRLFSGILQYDSIAIAYKNILLNSYGWQFIDEGICCMKDIEITKVGNVLSTNISGAKYQWYECPNFNEIHGETKQYIVTNNNTTNYAVSIKIGDCVQFSKCSNTMPTTIQELQERKTWEIYPNPTNSLLYIKSDKSIENKVKELYNTIGQLIFATKENEIDVSRYTAGVYYLKCDSQIKKLIIE